MPLYAFPIWRCRRFGHSGGDSRHRRMMRDARARRIACHDAHDIAIDGKIRARSARRMLMNEMYEMPLWQHVTFFSRDHYRRCAHIDDRLRRKSRGSLYSPDVAIF